MVRFSGGPKVVRYNELTGPFTLTKCRLTGCIRFWLTTGQSTFNFRKMSYLVSVLYL